MLEIQAPHNLARCEGKTTIFLGGSIEMGTAEKWQDKLVNEMKDRDVVLLNPRRDDWDSSITQRASDPKFAEQVNWELDALETSDIILFYFDPNTKSPITLLELGLFAASESKHVIVCCPDGFWRKGNVEIVCSRNKLPLCNSYDVMMETLEFVLDYNEEYFLS